MFDDDADDPGIITVSVVRCALPDGTFVWHGQLFGSEGRSEAAVEPTLAEALHSLAEAAEQWTPPQNS